MIEYPTNLLTTNLIIHLLTHSLTHSLLLVQQPLSVNLPSYQLTLSTHPINTPYQFTHTASPLTPPLNSHPLPLTPPSSQQPSPSPPTPDPPLLTPPPSSYPPLLSTAIRVSKDLAESKCLRLESDLKATEERQHQLEERNGRLCKSLEEVHRAAAWQGRTLPTHCRKLQMHHMHTRY